MGIPTSAIPEKMRRCMSRADRRPLGRAGLTTAEAAAKQMRCAERQLQDDMANLLRQRNLFFDSSRMDRATTNRKGMPDFRIVLPGGRALMVEAKVPGGELEHEQQMVFEQYWKQTGQVVYIVWNLQDFKTLLDEHHP